MKITMLVSMAGPEVSLNAGDEVEMDDETAKRMFEADPPQAIPSIKSTKERRAAPTPPAAS